MEEAARSESIVEIIVDGSFVSNAEDPHDVDLLVVISEDLIDRNSIPMMDYNLISKRRVRAKYKFDVLIARERSPEYYVGYFSQVRGSPGLEKGILRIRP